MSPQVIHETVTDYRAVATGIRKARLKKAMSALYKEVVV